MDAQRQHQYGDLGPDYFWLAGKYDLLLRVLQSHLPERSGTTGPPLRILDCGCGPGNLMLRLEPLGTVFGSERFEEGIRIARSRGLSRVVQSDARALGLKDGAFDLVVLADVIEHIDDDIAALREAARVCRQGGLVVVTVPAFQWLWGHHDDIYGHLRRYRLPELRRKIEVAGLEVDLISYIEPMYVLPMLIVRKLRRLLKAPAREDFYVLPGWLNRLLRRLIAAEGHVITRCRIPIGVTLVCVARKPAAADGEALPAFSHRETVPPQRGPTR